MGGGALPVPCSSNDYCPLARAALLSVSCSVLRLTATWARARPPWPAAATVRLPVHQRASRSAAVLPTRASRVVSMARRLVSRAPLDCSPTTSSQRAGRCSPIPILILRLVLISCWPLRSSSSSSSSSVRADSLPTHELWILAHSSMTTPIRVMQPRRMSGQLCSPSPQQRRRSQPYLVPACRRCQPVAPADPCFPRVPVRHLLRLARHPLVSAYCSSWPSSSTCLAA